ncbi:hypothetical protein Riv7116_2537 [Rivularia sp. PCC 7116]|uniref:hypothetical protein n=1 Tax=Rivularia sp. PCC 7116 TaxID=373994 RepID=UPI00029EF403|nr:hypothetical protein [Rivularia sp. PCC 7116]AFY55045.1 hypothetical protein Riv7116_2537 [Rivularia sp. PCC 7116]
MVKHFILSINPTAKHEWDRCILRDVLSSKRPDIAKLIAEEVDADGGNYLISVNIDIEVLQQEKAPTAEQLQFSFTEASQKPQLREAA